MDEMAQIRPEPLTWASSLFVSGKASGHVVSCSLGGPGGNEGRL